MATLRNLQQAHLDWLNHNFPNQTPHQALLGVMEEVGELSHAHLKAEQGIRGTEDTLRAEARDAIGDIIIYLASYCNTNGYDLEQCVIDAWRQVSARDWQANPENGKVVMRTAQCTCPHEVIDPNCEVHSRLKISGIEHDHES